MNKAEIKEAQEQLEQMINKMSSGVPSMDSKGYDPDLHDAMIKLMSARKSLQQI